MVWITYDEAVEMLEASAWGKEMALNPPEVPGLSLEGPSITDDMRVRMAVGVHAITEIERFRKENPQEAKEDTHGVYLREEPFRAFAEALRAS